MAFEKRHPAEVKRENGDVDMHVALIATMVTAGAVISAYVAQRGDAVLVPVRIKRRRD